MINIIVVLPTMDAAKGVKNVLVRGGFRVTGICTTGAQAISQADGLHDGIIISSYKLPDMLYSQLQELMPKGFEMLLMASQKLIRECYGSGVITLSMPLNVNDLLSTVNMMADGIERRRRKQRAMPKQRDEKQTKLIWEAKEMLMARNHMTEEEAHKYLQKTSMDSGNDLAETAQMILAMMVG